MVVTRYRCEHKKPVNDACCLDMQCLQQYQAARQKLQIKGQIVILVTQPTPINR